MGIRERGKRQGRGVHWKPQPQLAPKALTLSPECLFGEGQTPCWGPCCYGQGPAPREVTLILPFKERNCSLAEGLPALGSQHSRALPAWIAVPGPPTARPALQGSTAGEE